MTIQRLIIILLLPSLLLSKTGKEGIGAPVQQPKTVSGFSFLISRLTQPMLTRNDPFDSQALAVRSRQTPGSVLNNAITAEQFSAESAHYSLTDQEPDEWINPNPLPPLRGEEAALAGVPDPAYIRECYELTRRYINHTPLHDLGEVNAVYPDSKLPQETRLLVKDESRQVGQAYKIRGIATAVLMKTIREIETQQQKSQGQKPTLKHIVWATESTGNHALALTRAVYEILPRFLKAQYPEWDFSKEDLGRIQLYTPHDIARSKKEALEASGATLKSDYADYHAAREAVLRDAKWGKVYYIGHDSLDVVAGHAGLLLEVAEQLDAQGLMTDEGPKELVTITVPAGSFGLSAGLTLAAKGLFRNNNFRIIAAQSTKVRGGNYIAGSMGTDAQCSPEGSTF